MFQKFLGVLIVSTGAYSAFVATQVGSEQLRLDVPSTVALGPLHAGKKLEVSVAVRNPCRFPVEILQIYSSCSCSKASISSGTILPDETVKLTATISAREGVSSVGSQIDIVFHVKGSSKVAQQQIQFHGMVE